MKFGCAAKAPDFRWVTPKGTQDAPRDLILRWLGVLAPQNARCPRGRNNVLWCVIETTLDMQIRAKLLQRTLGGGGNRGLL